MSYIAGGGMRARGEQARALGRREWITGLLARERGLAELIAGLSLGGEQAGEGYSLAVLPRGFAVGVTTRGREVTVRGRRRTWKLQLETAPLPPATARGILDPATSILWVMSFLRLNGYDYAGLSWRLQQHLLSSHFPSSELGRGQGLVLRLLPREPFSPDSLSAAYRKYFSRAKALLLEPPLPSQPLHTLYFRHYLRQARWRLRLNWAEGRLRTADGVAVLGAEDVGGKALRRKGCYELSLRLRDSARLAEMVSQSLNADFQVEQPVFPQLLRVERRRPRAPATPSIGKLLNLLHRRAEAFGRMRLCS